MDEFITPQQIREAADAVSQRTDYTPRIGLVLGSGLNDLADAVVDADVVAVDDIPHWPTRTGPCRTSGHRRPGRKAGARPTGARALL